MTDAVRERSTAPLVHCPACDAFLRILPEDEEPVMPGTTETCPDCGEPFELTATMLAGKGR